MDCSLGRLPLARDKGWVLAMLASLALQHARGSDPAYGTFVSCTPVTRRKPDGCMLNTSDQRGSMMNSEAKRNLQRYEFVDLVVPPLAAFVKRLQTCCHGWIGIKLN